MKNITVLCFLYLAIGLTLASPTPKEALEYMVLQAEELSARTEVFLGEQQRLGHGSSLVTLEAELGNLKLLCVQLKGRLSLPNFEDETVLVETQKLEIKLLMLENVVTEEVKSVRKAIEEGHHTVTAQHPTAAPTTKSPLTKPPTAAPTTESPPTKPPTAAPTTKSQPTKPPTAAPTTESPPTKPPTAAPTTESPPTKPPTAAPTTESPPTKPPTAAPTSKSPPTKPPTAAPTTILPSTNPQIVEAQRIVALATKFLEFYHGLERLKIRTEVSEIVSLIASYQSDLNPQRLAEMNEHTTALRKILRRHGITY